MCFRKYGNMEEWNNRRHENLVYVILCHYIIPTPLYSQEQSYIIVTTDGGPYHEGSILKILSVSLVVVSSHSEATILLAEKMTLMGLAQEAGFLEPRHSANDPIYQWVHDKVREAALSLVPAEEMSGMRGELGRHLHDQLADGYGNMVFVIANLLHDGPFPVEKNEKISL